MAGEVQRGHAISALVLGVMELVFGLIIIICSFVLGGKVNAGTALTPYWAGIPVRRYNYTHVSIFSYSIRRFKLQLLYQ